MLGGSGGKSAAVASAILLTLASRAGAIAFVGAEGFGANATGGRGGTVVHVTNLNNSGAGSLRDAISQSNRIVVFDVGGVINLTSQLVFSSNVSVYGQTAPGGGITVNGQGISLSGKTNVICRYIRFRSSHLTSDGTKALNVTGGSNMIFDHCSISWGRWDNVGFTDNSSDITLQNCIVSEAIDPQRLGALIDSSRRISVLRNLWIDNQSRNPKGKADMQYINNVVYNWGSSGYDGGHSAAVWNQDLINNYSIKGPSSSDTFYSQFTDTDHVYQTGNLVDLDKNGGLNGRAVVESDFKANSSGGPTATFMTSAFNHPDVPATILTALQAYSFVAAEAGDSKVRDSVDTRLINQLKTLGGQGAIITDETLVGGAGTIAGGTLPLDSDGDGIPNFWESANGLNPNVSDSTNLFGSTGFTNIEVYANSLVPEPVTPAMLLLAATGLLGTRRRRLV